MTQFLKYNEFQLNEHFVNVFAKKELEIYIDEIWDIMFLFNFQ